MAIRLSLKLAALTTAALLLLGLPIAAWLAFGKARGKFLVEALVSLPLVLPPTVLGFCLLVALGPHSPMGALWERLMGRPLAFSFSGLLLASILYSLPFAVQPFAAGFAAVDRRLLEASACLGAGPLRGFLSVVLPLSWPALLAGSILSFAHTLGEFGVVLMVGGNLPGETRTVSIAIYDAVQTLDYATAGRTALALLAFSFLVLALTYGLQRRWMPWARR